MRQPAAEELTRLMAAFYQQNTADPCSNGLNIGGRIDLVFYSHPMILAIVSSVKFLVYEGKITVYGNINDYEVK